MDAIECMRTRRSIRRYKPDPIPRELLEDILDTAMTAPSGTNLQHWHFVVLESPEAMEKFKTLTAEVPARFHPVLAQRFPNHPKTVKATEGFLATLGGAPVCVLAFFDKPDFPDRDSAIQSVSAAIENLLLAAWAHAVGSCWMSVAQRMGLGPAIQEAFAPGKGEFIAAITLGYPDQSPPMPRRKEGRVTFL
ncbi:MAG: nitroreductase [Oscillospiraceae bacterium]|nr:nitroreductase [Oscillospiraceae bacterium]